MKPWARRPPIPTFQNSVHGLIQSLNSWLWYRRLPNVTATKAQTALVKETLGSLVSQLWPKKRYVFPLWCSWTNHDYTLYVYYSLYTIIQLWIRRCCLARCWKLSLNSRYKDRVIEKIGSGESVTWLVRNCDVTAGFLPLRYIFMWQKLYVWLYHNGDHNKTCSKCFA